MCVAGAITKHEVNVNVAAWTKTVECLLSCRRCPCMGDLKCGCKAVL